MIAPPVPPLQRPAYTIVLPTDFSPSAERALPVALALGERLQADLHLVHVLGGETGVAAIRKEQHARARLEATRMLYRYSLPHRGSLTMRLVVLQGTTPEAEVVQYAAQQHAHLIVMGLSGWEVQNGRRPGTTALRVAEQSPCPVLLVPPQAAAGRELRHVVACGEDEVQHLAERFSTAIGARWSASPLHALPGDCDLVVLPHDTLPPGPEFTSRFCGEGTPCLVLVAPAAQIPAALPLAS